MEDAHLEIGTVRKERERGERTREGRMREQWKGRRRDRVGTLAHSHTLFTMVSCHVLYRRCAFGYSGVNCEDREYKSLALLLSTWKTSINLIQNSVRSPKTSGSCHREGGDLPAACPLGGASPSRLQVTGSSTFAVGNHRTWPKRWAGASGQVPSQPRAS